MRLRTLALTLLASIVVIEAGVFGWKMWKPEPSDEPTFTWTTAASLFASPSPNFATAIAIYNADRGAEWETVTDEGAKLTVFYFEWDEIDYGPIMDVLGHTPEECNVAAGYTPIRPGEVRWLETEHDRFRFEASVLASPTGQTVYVFKMPWIQGIGATVLSAGRDRLTRFQRSFTRHRGAARIIQGSVLGANSEQEAWDFFEARVLAEIEWQSPST